MVRKGFPPVALIVAAAALHLVVTLLAVNPWHPDEHFQILELAWARAGRAPTDALPWEWAARIRSSLQPTIALVVLKALGLVGITSPWAWVLTLRIGSLAAAGAVLLLAARHASRGMSPAGRRMLLLSALFLWFLPLFLSRFTAENWGGLALAAALPLTEDPRERGRDFTLACLLGLSFVFRFQMAFAIAGLLLWIALETKDGWRRAGRVAAMAAAAVGACSVVDRWFYGEWVITPWRYFHVNLVEGVASTFGTSPWWSYLAWLPLWTAPPVGLAICGLVLAGIAARPRSAWSWTFVGFLVGHSLIPHKELRFVLPLLYHLPILMAFGWEAVTERFGSLGARPAWRAAGAILLAQNAVLALALATPAIHRGKEQDGHYLRFLWREAEARPDATLYVLTTDRSPWLVRDLETNVFRHPRVNGVTYAPGASLAASVPPGTERKDILVLTRDSAPPVFADAPTLELAYRAEPGYRVMAGWIGAEDAALVRWLEKVDRWTDSEWVRRVYRVKG